MAVAYLAFDIKNMKNVLFLLIFLAVGAKAQYEILPFGDVKRTPIREMKFTDVTGSPYLYDFWSKGKVVLKNGKKYQNDSLKYNVLEDKLIFKNDDGALMYFAEPVTAFEFSGKELNPLRFINGLPAISGLTPDSYFQVIAEGKINLYKKIRKEINESKQYGSAVTNKSISTISNYYSYKEGTLAKITPNKKTISALFGITEDQLTDYTGKEKVDFKKDQDLYTLFKYLNH